MLVSGALLVAENSRVDFPRVGRHFRPLRWCLLMGRRCEVEPVFRLDFGIARR